MTKSQNDIQLVATKIIVEQLNLASDTKINLDQKFTDLGADSLDAVELVIKFEDAFKVEISDDVAVELNSLQDVVLHITK